MIHSKCEYVECKSGGTNTKQPMSSTSTAHTLIAQTDLPALISAEVRNLEIQERIETG